MKNLTVHGYPCRQKALKVQTSFADAYKERLARHQTLNNKAAKQQNNNMSSNSTPSLPSGYDWARNAFYFDSIPVAVAFAGVCLLYLVAICYCAIKTNYSAVRRLYIYGILWGLTRVSGLGLRAYTLTGDNGSNTSLVTTTQILCSIGFLPLIRFLIFETLCVLRTKFPQLPVDRIDRIQSLVFLICTVMLITSLVDYSQHLPAAITSNDQSMRDSSSWVFFAYAVGPTLLGLLLVFSGSEKQGGVMVLTGVCLSVKMAYSLYKNYETDFKATEVYFYALNVAPELLMVTLYLTPRLLEDFARDADDAKERNESLVHQGGVAAQTYVPMQGYSNAEVGQGPIYQAGVVQTQGHYYQNDQVQLQTINNVAPVYFGKGR
ncbi:hypothetical protein BC830DRAFT_1142056 [Chytriomyces sp. MP71]|nr:hypothetical protein BC830DRAFT_1142056 [Chytriomyces sp. MP71]